MNSNAACRSSKWVPRLKTNKPLKLLSFGVILFFSVLTILASAFQLHAAVCAPDIEYREAEQIVIPANFGTKGKWRAIAYEANVKQFEHWDQNECPAKLCFVEENGKTEQKCFEAVAKKRTILPNFQWAQKLTIVPILKNKYPQQGVLFVAMCSYGGSGASFLFTLWTFEEEVKEFVNILPEVTISNLGEYKFLEGVADALDGILVTADFVYEKGESHFSPHRYRINIYQYDQADKAFKLIGEYVTKTKYGSDEINVISPEIETIKELVARRASAHLP
jgi:hypothetical protein